MSQPSRIPFEAQLDDGYCLPACATMLLAALGTIRSILHQHILDTAAQARLCGLRRIANCRGKLNWQHPRMSSA